MRRDDDICKHKSKELKSTAKKKRIGKRSQGGQTKRKISESLSTRRTDELGKTNQGENSLRFKLTVKRTSQDATF